jgi:hypothetical protein
MGSMIGGFESRKGLGIFLLTTTSRPVVGPAQPPIQWVPEALSLGVKRPGCEADHSHPSSAEVKECVEIYLHSPNMPSWRGARLEKHRDNFTFTFTYGLDDQGFESQQGLGIFLLTTACRPVLRPTQPPIRWVPGALSLGVKRPRCEADHSPPSSAEVKNAWSYTPSWRGAQLKQRDNFTFTFNFTLHRIRTMANKQKQ